MGETEVVCVVCPLGCHITLTGEDGQKAEGARCSKGIDYARQELRDPMRVLTTTVRVRGGTLPLLPVRSQEPVPLRKIAECMLALREVEAVAPIRMGQVILDNVAGTGVKVVASRSLPTGSVGHHPTASRG